MHPVPAIATTAVLIRGACFRRGAASNDVSFSMISRGMKGVAGDCCCWEGGGAGYGTVKSSDRTGVRSEISCGLSTPEHPSHIAENNGNFVGIEMRVELVDDCGVAARATISDVADVTDGAGVAPEGLVRRIQLENVAPSELRCLE